MNLISRLLRKGRVTLRRQSVSKELMIQILGGGDLLVGMRALGRMQHR